MPEYTPTGFATVTGIAAGERTTSLGKKGFATLAGTAAGLSESIFEETGRSVISANGYGPISVLHVRTGNATVVLSGYGLFIFIVQHHFFHLAPQKKWDTVDSRHWALSTRTQRWLLEST